MKVDRNPLVWSWSSPEGPEVRPKSEASDTGSQGQGTLGYERPESDSGQPDAPPEDPDAVEEPAPLSSSAELQGQLESLQTDLAQTQPGLTLSLEPGPGASREKPSLGLRVVIQNAEGAILGRLEGARFLAAAQSPQPTLGPKTEMRRGHLIDRKA